MGFLQLTPENIAQARSLSYPEAFKLDRTLGYQKNFPGGVGKVKYGLEGLKSIFGFGDEKIGGATPLTRKVALDAMDLGKKGINLAGKFLSKASLPLSILTPTRLGSSELTEEDRQNMMKNNNMSMGIMDPNLLDEYYTSGELYNIDDTGRIPGFTDKIKGGIETMRDKLGPIGDFFSKGGVMGNVISAIGKRGDESTRGIAGLNLQDVFNIDSFGSDEDPTKDPYGINIVSAFGNYKDYVTQKARELAKMQFKTKTGKQRQDFYDQAFKQIQEQQRIEQAQQAARDRARSEAAYATQTGEGSGYTGGFDASTGNYDDPFSPGDTE